MTETLRLKPSVPSGNARVTPPEGLVIDEVRIPGDTIVIVPQYVVQRDERNYVRPLEFLPERWLEEGKDLVLNGRAFFPFTIGKDFYLRLDSCTLVDESLKGPIPALASNLPSCRCGWLYAGSRESSISRLRLVKTLGVLMLGREILLLWQCHHFKWSLRNGWCQIRFRKAA